MEIIIPGHQYKVSNFEDKNSGQIIQFIQKEEAVLTVDSTEGVTEVSTLVTVSDGTTNEELLEVLIDRLNFLQKKVPSRETALAITNLEQALMWLEKRTRDRLKRGVEGTRKI